MATSPVPAGYVPASADADGSEDPAPTAALHATGAVSTAKPCVDKKKQPIAKGKDLKPNTKDNG